MFCMDLNCLSVSGSSSARTSMRQRDDRPAPAEPDGVVEEHEDRLEEVDQRLEDVGEDEHGSGV